MWKWDQSSEVEHIFRRIYERMCQLESQNWIHFKTGIIHLKDCLLYKATNKNKHFFEKCLVWTFPLTLSWESYNTTMIWKSVLRKSSNCLQRFHKLYIAVSNWSHHDYTVLTVSFICTWLILIRINLCLKSLLKLNTSESSISLPWK